MVGCPACPELLQRSNLACNHSIGFENCHCLQSFERRTCLRHGLRCLRRNGPHGSPTEEWRWGSGWREPFPLAARKTQLCPFRWRRNLCSWVAVPRLSWKMLLELLVGWALGSFWDRLLTRQRQLHRSSFLGLLTFHLLHLRYVSEESLYLKPFHRHRSRSRRLTVFWTSATLLKAVWLPLFRNFRIFSGSDWFRRSIAHKSRNLAFEDD